MTDPALGLTMLGLIVIAVMMGFPTAFTLMGLGMIFGFMAFYDPSAHWIDNHVFDLFVQRTYGGMTNDTLLSIPLFVLMGYLMERGALVDKMFGSVQLAFRKVPASLAVATLMVCTFWGIASGLVGAVVVLMGVIAMGPMLRAGYDARLAAGVITAGGTLGILIPPSVMIIVYAAVAGESVVRLYAAAMVPGFLLAGLYLVYILGWAMINPKIAPRIPESEVVIPTPAWVTEVTKHSRHVLVAFARSLFAGALPVSRGELAKAVAMALVPLALVATTLGGTWWYVTDYRPAQAMESATPTADAPEQLGGATEAPPTAPEPVSRDFLVVFGVALALSLAVLARYYWKFDAERFTVLSLLTRSVMPLGLLTILVLAVILFGITTATESAGVGALGALIMGLWERTLTWKRIREAIYLTAKTTAMVCWLFVGSALFSAVFALHGGQSLVEHWVVGMNLTPVQFMLLSQAIIFILGWPLEWTEILVIFVPIFLPMLAHFQIDPVLWGTIVFVNLQAAFLSPPVAMSAYYLKGVAPPHVTLNTIFAGMMPYMVIVGICMVMLYIWPSLVLWLPTYLYGK